jgi:hypothetical protein
MRIRHCNLTIRKFPLYNSVIRRRLHVLRIPGTIDVSPRLRLQITGMLHSIVADSFPASRT